MGSTHQKETLWEVTLMDFGLVGKEMERYG